MMHKSTSEAQQWREGGPGRRGIVPVSRKGAPPRRTVNDKRLIQIGEMRFEAKALMKAAGIGWIEPRGLHVACIRINGRTTCFKTLATLKAAMASGSRPPKSP